MNSATMTQATTSSSPKAGSPKAGRPARKLPRGVVKIVVKDDGRKYYAFEKFRFMPEWGEYIAAISEDKRRGAMFDAVVEYGLYSYIIPNIEGADREYLLTAVCPELDKQHKRLMTGREL